MTICEAGTAIAECVLVYFNSKTLPQTQTQKNSPDCGAHKIDRLGQIVRLAAGGRKGREYLQHGRGARSVARAARVGICVEQILREHSARVDLCGGVWANARVPKIPKIK